MSSTKSKSAGSYPRACELNRSSMEADDFSIGRLWVSRGSLQIFVEVSDLGELRGASRKGTRAKRGRERKLAAASALAASSSPFWQS